MRKHAIVHNFTSFSSSHLTLSSIKSATSSPSSLANIPRILMFGVVANDKLKETIVEVVPPSVKLKPSS